MGFGISQVASLVSAANKGPAALAPLMIGAAPNAAKLLILRRIATLTALDLLRVAAACDDEIASAVKAGSDVPDGMVGALSDAANAGAVRLEAWWSVETRDPTVDDVASAFGSAP